MPFRLKNDGATYRRMMNKVFQSQIGQMLEVYMVDLIVKTKYDVDHISVLTEVFYEVRKYNEAKPRKVHFWGSN